MPASLVLEPSIVAGALTPLQSWALLLLGAGAIWGLVTIVRSLTEPVPVEASEDADQEILIAADVASARAILHIRPTGSVRHACRSGRCDSCRAGTDSCDCSHHLTDALVLLAEKTRIAS